MGEHRVELSNDDRAKVRALARDLPAVWQAPTTHQADRKAMLRLVVEEIALSPVSVPKRVTHVEAQWRSGAVTKLDVPRPDRRTRWRTPAETVERIRSMVQEGMSDEEIAARLNEAGATTGASRPWNIWAVSWARARAKITRLCEDCPCDHPVPDRHPDGCYSVAATAKRFGVSSAVVYRWVKYLACSPAPSLHLTRKPCGMLDGDDEGASRKIAPGDHNGSVPVTDASAGGAI